MKNFEVYEDKIKESKGCIALNKSNELVLCIGFRCRDCKFSGRGNGKYCLQNMFEWLYKEHQKPKIKIPLATKVILENLKDNWNWIAKDMTGRVYVYDTKPFKKVSIWNNNDNDCDCDCDSANVDKLLDEKLLDFISWNDKEPTNIKELLENCEVIEDE